MKVYVLTSSYRYDEERPIHGIFSTKEEAERILRGNKKDLEDMGYDAPIIKEVELDSFRLYGL